MSRRPLACLPLLCSLYLAPATARATDVVRAEPPAAVTDNTLQIGSRSLRLPPGDWFLVARQVRSLVNSPRRIDAVDAWVVRLDGKRFRQALHLALPSGDGPWLHPWGEDPCAKDVNIQRQDLSRGLLLPECLAIIGHRDLPAAFEGRPRVLRWIQGHQADPGEAVVQFAYRERASGTFGGVSLYFPADCFPGDDDARKWAHGVREAFRPFFEGRKFDIDLPPPPVTAGSCRSGAAAASTQAR